MEPEKQRIKIAEACGWTKVKPYLRDMEYGGIVIGGIVPNAEMMDSQGADYKVFEIPDYLNDLNAMHMAYRTLSVIQRTRFIHILADIMLDVQWMNFSDNPFVCAELANANAAQRAEAFLRTLGLWEEN